MLSGNALLKQPIITHDTGRVIASIDNVLVDPFSNRVVAFVTTQTRSNGTIIVPWTGVKAVKPDRVIVWATSMLVRAKELFEIRRLIQRGVLKRGTRFQTADGVLLGGLADVYFNELTGELVGYEIVRGSLLRGDYDRRFIPAPDTITRVEGKNTVQLPPGAAHPPATEQHCETRLQRALQTIDQQRVMKTERTTLAQYLVSYIKGCSAQRTVITPEGYILVVEGQTITQDTIRYAQRKRRLTDLLTAVEFDLTAWRNAQQSSD